MSSSVLYSEEEPFSPLLTLVSFLGVVVLTGVLVAAPAERGAPAIIIAEGTLIFLFMLNAYHLRVAVHSDRIYLRLGLVLPLWWKNIRPSEIKSARVVELGLRRWSAGVHVGRFQGRRALTALTGGTRAVYLERKKGWPIVIGSAKPELLVRAIEKARAGAAG